MLTAFWQVLQPEKGAGVDILASYSPYSNLSTQKQFASNKYVSFEFLFLKGPFFLI